MTKKTIDNARNYYHQAHEIRRSSVGFLRGHVEKMRGVIAGIHSDRHLSRTGRDAKLLQAKAKAGKELLQQIHTRRQEYAANMRKAIKLADAIIHAKAAKPDATKLERFEAEFRTLKTEIMLSTRTDRAVERLTQFVERIDDAFLAGIVREHYADVIGPIITTAGSDASVKLTLADTFEGLKSRFETPEVTEARSILEAASVDVDSPQLFFTGTSVNPGVAVAAVEDAFSYNTEEGRRVRMAQYLNDTESFFQLHPEDKPGEYVDVDPII